MREGGPERGKATDGVAIKVKGTQAFVLRSHVCEKWYSSISNPPPPISGPPSSTTTLRLFPFTDVTLIPRTRSREHEADYQLDDFDAAGSP